MTPLGCAGASANSQFIADKYNPTLDVFDDLETDESSIFFVTSSTLNPAGRKSAIF
jgi:hypothetical protein